MMHRDRWDEYRATDGEIWLLIILGAAFGGMLPFLVLFGAQILFRWLVGQ